MCKRCFNVYETKDNLLKHIKTCNEHNDGKSEVKMPKEGSIIKFKNNH